jgi:uncharacterized RDD family membrane protein YckC
MVCARCGAPLTAEARFCMNCGAPVAGAGASATPPTSSDPSSPQLVPAGGAEQPVPAWAMGTRMASQFAPAATASAGVEAGTVPTPGGTGTGAPPPAFGAAYPAIPAAVAAVRYAGFWRRFWGLVIDGVLLSCVLMPLRIGLRLGPWGAWNGLERGDMTFDRLIPMLMGSLVFVSVKTVADALYFTLMQSSIKQATIGQMVLGLKVTDLHGRRISGGKALARYFAAWLSSLTLLIGYIIAAFTDKKQTLHDMIVGTLVVRSER